MLLFYISEYNRKCSKVRREYAIETYYIEIGWRGQLEQKGQINQELDLKA